MIYYFKTKKIIKKMSKKNVVLNTTTETNTDLKKQILDIISSSTLSYLISPIRSKRLLIKIIWIVFLIGFLFASIYYVLINILDFLQYDTTTSIYEINEQQAYFPTISLCNTKNSNFDIKILDLWFQNENLLNEWQNHFESYTDVTYGQCLRFNSGLNMLNESISIKKLTKAGLDEGLWLNIYFNTTYDTNLLMIYIHNNTQNPLTIYNLGHYIQPGSYSYFNIKRVYDQKLELPYNDCYKNVSKSANYNQTIIDYMKQKKREYSQKECLLLCKNLKYKEMSNCNYTLKSLDQNIIISKSANDTLSKCNQIFFKQFNINELCYSNYCPLLCDIFTYDVSTHSIIVTSRGNLNSKSSNNFIGFNTFENVTKTFYAIRVYYQDFKYTLIKQQPKIEIFGLISNVGGTLGLFLGFSFISLLELFEVVAELVYNKINF